MKILSPMAQLQVTLEAKIRHWFQNVAWHQTSVDSWDGHITGRLKVLWVPTDTAGNTSSKDDPAVPKATNLSEVFADATWESRHSAAYAVQVCWEYRCFPGSWWQRGVSSASLDIWHFSCMVGKVIPCVVKQVKLHWMFCFQIHIALDLMQLHMHTAKQDIYNACPCDI